MEDKSTSAIDAQDEQDESRKGSKVNSVPIKGLREILAFSDNVYKELGDHGYHDKNAVARANGLSYHTIKQTLSTCQQYGLLINKYGEGYKLTDLFISIVHPKNDLEYNESIVASLNSSEIFRGLNDAFNNKRLPALSGISNTLIRDYGLKQDTASKVAAIYVDNLKDFGFIDQNGFVTLSKGVSRTPEPKADEHKNDPPPPPPPPDKPDETILDILIPLKEKRQAHLIIPMEYKDEDINRIIKFVDALKNE
ncbi:MAG TPA: hypothetical protein VG367_14510 [Mucilaginibacter sp.]|jgi:hypothetical protein|nr:hypothetical protein [Mucilaginibacter sp.]